MPSNNSSSDAFAPDPWLRVRMGFRWMLAGVVVTLLSAVLCQIVIFQLKLDGGMAERNAAIVVLLTFLFVVMVFHVSSHCFLVSAPTPRLKALAWLALLTSISGWALLLGGALFAFLGSLDIPLSDVPTSLFLGFWLIVLSAAFTSHFICLYLWQDPKERRHSHGVL